MSEESEPIFQWSNAVFDLGTVFDFALPLDHEMPLEHYDRTENLIFVMSDTELESSDEEAAGFCDLNLADIVRCVRTVATNTYSTRAALEDFAYELVRDVILPEWKRRLELSPDNFVSITWPLLSEKVQDELSIGTLYSMYSCCRTMDTTVSYKWFVLAKQIASVLLAHGVRSIARNTARSSSRPTESYIQSMLHATRWIATLVDEAMQHPLAVTLLTPPVSVMQCPHLFVVDDRMMFFGTLPEYVHHVNQRIALDDSQGFLEGMQSMYMHAIVTLQETLLMQITIPGSRSMIAVRQ